MRLLLIAEVLELLAVVRRLGRVGRARVGEHRDLLEPDRLDQEVAQVVVARRLGAGEGRPQRAGRQHRPRSERSAAQQLAAVLGGVAHPLAAA